MNNSSNIKKSNKILKFADNYDDNNDDDDDDYYNTEKEQQQLDDVDDDDDDDEEEEDEDEEHVHENDNEKCTKITIISSSSTSMMNDEKTIEKLKKEKEDLKTAMIAESRIKAKQFDAEKLKPFFIEYKEEPHEITDYDVCSNVLLLLFVLLGLVLVFLCGLGIAVSNIL
jgi:hypothetical protein